MHYKYMHREYAYKHTQYTVNIQGLYRVYAMSIQPICNGISEHSQRKAGRMFGFLAEIE